MHVGLVGLFLLLHPGHDIGCENVTMDGTARTYPSPDTTLQSMVRTLKEENSIELPVTVCESRAAGDGYMPFAIGRKYKGRDGRERGLVVVPYEVVRTASRQGLRALVAHELAHFVVPTTEDCLLVELQLHASVQERAACESPADVQAAAWTSTEAVTDHLEEMRGRLMPYMADEHARRAWKRFIGLRIEAVRTSAPGQPE